MFVGSFNGIYVTELTDDGLSVKRNENGTPTLKKSKSVVKPLRVPIFIRRTAIIICLHL